MSNNKQSILQKQLEECEKLWSKYSCDCLWLEIKTLRKKIKEGNNEQQ